MACVFLEIGQDVHVSGSIADAVNEGVRQGYSEGYLRKSVVRDPLNRVNTGDNTPAMLYYDLVPGDAIRITVAPKGFGSENMSQLKMLKPSDGVEGAKEFIVRVVEGTGPEPLPAYCCGRRHRRHVRQMCAACERGAHAQHGRTQPRPILCCA